MGEDDQIRAAAFAHVRRLSDTHDRLTSNELKPGFLFNGERIPLVNIPGEGYSSPGRWIFCFPRWGKIPCN